MRKNITGKTESGVIPEFPRGLPRRAYGTPRNDSGGSGERSVVPTGVLAMTAGDYKGA